MMLIQVQTPPGATVERTEKVLDDVRQYLDANESNLVESTFAISGFNFAGHGQNSGLIFLRLKDWSTRTAEKDKVQALLERIGVHVALCKHAEIIPNNAPHIHNSGPAPSCALEHEATGGLTQQHEQASG